MNPDSATRVLGYARVSTEDQHRSGLGLAAQKTALEHAAAGRGWELELVVEEAASGKSMAKRPVLAAALARLKAGQVDALAVAKLDRLSRSVLDFASLLERSEREKWALVLLDLGVDTTTPSGRLAANVVSAVAEYERQLIAARTRAAMAAKKAQGARLGRNRSTPDELLERVVRERDAGSTWQAIADGLNGDGIPTVAGGAKWRTSNAQALYRSAMLDNEAAAAKATAAA